MGAAHSHREVLRSVTRNGHESALILEDDAVLRDDLLDRLAEISPQLDRVDWDVFYLGLHLVRDGGKISANLGRVIEGYHAHAYAVKAQAVPRLIACINRALEELGGSFDGFDDPSLLKVYADPILAIQEPCYSHTRGAVLDRTPQYFHRFSREEFMANCREMREWEAEKSRESIRPKELDVLTLLQRARSHHRAGKLEAAEPLYKRILDRFPDHAEAMHYRGLLAHQSGDEALGMELLTRSLALDPRPEFYNNFASVLSASGKNEDALELLDEAIRLKPEYAEAFTNRAAVLDRLGLVDECIESCRKAIELKAEQGEPHARLGTLLLKQGKIEESIPILREAVRYAPRLPEAHLALGNALREQGDLEGALAAYRQAVELRPGWAEAYSNLGSTLQELGQLDEAVRLLKRSIELKGDYVDARWNLALSLLASRDFEAGWPEYEWRRKLKGDGLSSRNFAQPEWNGCWLRGRTILVICEQGLGDTIQFIRYASMLRERGAEVIVECQPRLRVLLESMGGFRVVARGEPLPSFDTYVRLLSLPAIFGTTLDSIPARGPYLKAEPARARPWEAQLSGGGFKIGIAWQGSTGYKGDKRRSLPLRAFAPLAAVPGVRLFGLQQGEGSAQIDGAEFAVHVFNPQPDAEGAFLDTAAIIGKLDLIVTSDTAIAHLAGALGARVWVALSYAPDWRWMLEREDSPWYPTMRLFRQSQPGNWNGVFERIASELRVLVRAEACPGSMEPMLAPSRRASFWIGSVSSVLKPNA